MSSATYDELHVDNLLAVNFSCISANFRTIDSFIKNFSHHQRRLVEVEKQARTIAQDLSGFKMSTQNTFSTLNDMITSRAGGKNKQDQQELVEIKKSLKDLKGFMADSTRSSMEWQESHQKETLERSQQHKSQIEQLYTRLAASSVQISGLAAQLSKHEVSFVGKAQFEEVSHKIKLQSAITSQINEKLTGLDSTLQDLNVRQFKETLEEIAKKVEMELEGMRLRLKNKVNWEENIQLEEMLLNHISYSYDCIARRYSSKTETKKALIFLEKRINQIATIMTPNTEDQPGEGLITTKKCISCSKDLNQLEGRLDRYKWGITPIKESTHEKFLSETLLSKEKMNEKINEKINEKSRLSQRVSQSKLSSPIKPNGSQKNYMMLFGKTSEIDIDLKAEYILREKGLATRMGNLK